MSSAEMMERIGKTAPRLKANFIGFYYLLTILTGVFVLVFRGRLAFAVDLAVAAFYFGVTALLYAISKPRISGKEVAGNAKQER